MSKYDSRSGQISRREALGLLGLGTGVGLVTALGEPVLDAAAAPAAQRAAAGTPPRGAIIRTILKDVQPDQLGTGATLIHEHLSLGKSPWGAPKPQWQWMNDDVQLMTDEVNATAKDGVSCIVDAGGLDLGRSIENLRQIAMHSNVHIVACGGFHLKADYPADTAQKSEDEIADYFYNGARTERWGALGEMGTGNGVPMDPEERKVLRASAKVHVRTGLPILTHTSGGVAQAALDQLDLFDQAGVDLNHLLIGHLNDIKDESAEMVKYIAKRGAYVGFDHSGKLADNPQAAVDVRTIMNVLHAGHEDRVLLSADFANQKLLRKSGGPGIDVVMSTTVPALRQAGVDDKTMRKILVDNPRRFLAFVPKNLNT